MKEGSIGLTPTRHNDGLLQRIGLHNTLPVASVQKGQEPNVPNVPVVLCSCAMPRWIQWLWCDSTHPACVEVGRNVEELVLQRPIFEKVTYYLGKNALES